MADRSSLTLDIILLSFPFYGPSIGIPLSYYLVGIAAIVFYRPPDVLIALFNFHDVVKRPVLPFP